MSLFVSYLFVAAGIGILAVASIRVLMENNALPELETIKKTLKKPLKAMQSIKKHLNTKKIRTNITSITAEKPENSHKIPLKQNIKATFKKKKSPLQIFLFGRSKQRLSSGEKLYFQRMKLLKNYMQINLERGVAYPLLHEKLVSAGWKDEDIGKAYRKIKKYGEV